MSDHLNSVNCCRPLYL